MSWHDEMIWDGRKQEKELPDQAFLNQTEMALADKLDRYGHSDYIPFHMPGHKRQSGDPDLVPQLPWHMDITEIDGFDNLHHAEGILKRSMEQAAAFYGTRKSIYCINGSTGGILSAIFAVTNPGDTILMGRNCHKSAYHGIFLHDLMPLYIYPQIDRETGIGCGYQPDRIQDMLKQHPEIKAVFITSPTYEGVISDIARIADIAHEYGVPLIVDEAHGAHLTMRGHLEAGDKSSLPVSATCLGADIVIQSLHKTLPALTQTAIVHVNGILAEPDRVQRYLSMFQTSSPSYILMASIDSCMRFLISEREKERRACYEKNLQMFRREIRKRSGFHLLERFPMERKEESTISSYWLIDPSKIPVCCDFLDGKEFYDCLLDRYHIQCEMCTGRYILLMTSMFDTTEMYERFLHALDDMNREHKSFLESQRTRKPDSVPVSQCGRKQTGVDDRPETSYVAVHDVQCPPEQVYTPLAADQMPKEEICLRDSIGRISAEYAYQYPPGIPLLVPGERIDEDVLKCLLNESDKGLKIEGLQDLAGWKIQVLKESSEKSCLKTGVRLV